MLPQRLREALRTQGFDPAKAAPYFETAWRKSFPGELYIDNPQQLDTFAASLLSAVNAPFMSTFPTGFSGITALTLVRT